MFAAALVFTRVVSSHGPAGLPCRSLEVTVATPAAAANHDFNASTAHRYTLCHYARRHASLAVNAPNATLSVFQLTGGTPVLTAEIPVGLEPVSVAVKITGRLVVNCCGLGERG